MKDLIQSLEPSWFNFFNKLNNEEIDKELEEIKTLLYKRKQLIEDIEQTNNIGEVQKILGAFVQNKGAHDIDVFQSVKIDLNKLFSGSSYDPYAYLHNDMAEIFDFNRKKDMEDEESGNVYACEINCWSEYDSNDYEMEDDGEFTDYLAITNDYFNRYLKPDLLDFLEIFSAHFECPTESLKNGIEVAEYIKEVRTIPNDEVFNKNVIKQYKDIILESNTIISEDKNVILGIDGSNIPFITMITPTAIEIVKNIDNERIEKVIQDLINLESENEALTPWILMDEQPEPDFNYGINELFHVTKSLFSEEEAIEILNKFTKDFQAYQLENEECEM